MRVVNGFGRRLPRWPRVMTALAILPLAAVALGTPLKSTAIRPIPLQSHQLSPAWQSNIGPGSIANQATLADLKTAMDIGTGASAALNGSGVGVALIDTGVAPVPGLPASQIVNGPDLSFESQAPTLRYLDTFGHGTNMAGIIVGNDPSTGAVGIAPKAMLTSIKVGTADGTVDVTQVIAALDWVVQHRNDDPANPIRVVNLSYGTHGISGSGQDDPLRFAEEQAFKAGIVVVAAAGNDAHPTLDNPASDQAVLSIGSVSATGTTVSPFTNGLGASTTSAEFVVAAPGESIVSLRDPGSNIDRSFPGAVVNGTLFRGSGTSQATAAVSGAIALLLQARPSLSPTQVLAIIRSSATSLASDKRVWLVNLDSALAAPTPRSSRKGSLSSGTGSVESDRGGLQVVVDGVSLAGQNCVFGPLDTTNWAAKSGKRTAWAGGVWMGYRFAGDGWTGSSWASKTWAAAAWTGRTWAGTSWVDPAWSGHYWSGHYWSATGWTGRYWSSEKWESQTWQ